MLLLGAGHGFTAQPAASEAPHAKLAIPTTPAEIWQALDSHVAALHASVQMKKLTGVHVHAFAVRDLVRAMPSRSPGLSADALAKLKSTSGFIDTLATRLDKSGDAGDVPATVAGLTKLEALLKQLRAVYPTGK